VIGAQRRGPAGDGNLEAREVSVAVSRIAGASEDAAERYVAPECGAADAVALGDRLRSITEWFGDTPSRVDAPCGVAAPGADGFYRLSVTRGDRWLLRAREEFRHGDPRVPSRRLLVAVFQDGCDSERCLVSAVGGVGETAEAEVVLPRDGEFWMVVDDTTGPPGGAYFVEVVRARP
jgi:hypothetical protein